MRRFLATKFALRGLTASLTTIGTPGYEIPAVRLGRDWTTATAGTTVTLSKGSSWLASVHGAGQTGLTAYGGRAGIHYMIGLGCLEASSITISATRN
jgi:hypothetical protein